MTVTYADGETETFDPIVGYHQVHRQHDRGLPNPSPARLQHEIRWSQPAPDPEPAVPE